MATANIIHDNSFDPNNVAKDRAARSNLLAAKDNYGREIKVIISVVMFLIFIEFSVVG